MHSKGKIDNDLANNELRVYVSILRVEGTDGARVLEAHAISEADCRDENDGSQLAVCEPGIGNEDGPPPRDNDNPGDVNTVFVNEA